MIVVRVVAVLVGLVVVVGVLRSAVRTVVVPRGEQVMLTRVVFLVVGSLYNLLTHRGSDRDRRHEVFARFAPTSLLLLAAIWVLVVFVGFIPIYWGLSSMTLVHATRLSGSSITTLGFVPPPTTIDALAAFAEAIIGLGLLALLIAYLPTIYSAFSRREAEVVKLEVRAGSPPSAREMLVRFERIGWDERFTSMWADWEKWFVETEESHTSQPALVLFRSQRVGTSWITSAGAVLDGAALSLAVIDQPWDPQAALTLRAGYLALRSIAAFHDVPFDRDPPPNAPISIHRAEFDALLDDLAAAGVGLKEDREQAWRDFAGWRVNYDTVLLGLCVVASAPEAPWSSDRVERFGPPNPWHIRGWRIAPLDTPPSW